MSAIIKKQSCKRGFSLPWGGPQILKTKHMVGTFCCPSDQHAYHTLHCSSVPSYMVFPLSVALLLTFTFSLSHHNINWRQKCQNKSIRKWTRSFERFETNTREKRLDQFPLDVCVRGTLGASCSKIQECGLIWEEDETYWFNKDILSVIEA